jgi:protein-S-isoprenylcysteine O-methyltransferase Ste14
MYHDPSLARAVHAARPRSAVSAGAGVSGLVGVALWIGVARSLGLDGPYAALVNVAACGAPMVLWSVLVDRVQRAPTTGIDWAMVRPLRETLDGSLVKLAGLWATWGGITLIYGTARFYWQGNFAFAMWCLLYSAPVLFVASVPYVLWIDRRLVEPRDGAWHLGSWLLGQAGAEREVIFGHLRSWGVKAFFLPFMLGIVPAGFGGLVRWEWRADPVSIAGGLITFMFVIDVAFATVGYLLTFRALDSHIRSATPYAAGWAAALICYPPFVLMEAGGPLDYHPGTAEWSWWFAGHPVVLGLFGIVLVALTATYALATVAFGLRFSNLTHRGILTHGPYAWTRHPAYLSKNLFWWVSTIPVLSTGSLVDAVRATLILAAVSGVYWWRAKTEERHLSADPDYRAYSAWIERHGLIARLLDGR